MDRNGPERRSRKLPARPFDHFRLVAFFASLGVSGALGGVLVLRGEGAGVRAQWILAITVIAVIVIAFAGVFFHRLRTQVVRWRETERYLVAIGRESQKYRTLLEGAADALLVVDPRDLRVVESNGRARELFEATRDDAPHSMSDLVDPASSIELGRAIADAAAGHGEAVSLTDVGLIGRGGARLVADARCAAIALDEGTIVQVALRDRTREREIERTLRIHERLSSVGLLTAGVAHEINNPLEGIGNYLKLLKRDGASDEDRRRWLDLVEHGFSRIREIVRDLLRFARPTTDKGEADLAAVVGRARKLAEYSEKLANVSVHVTGLDAPLIVVGDAGRLEQVVVNLLLNAGAAMSGGGRIEIRARRASECHGAIELDVVDDGPGVAPDIQARIFDPFFTTGGGTGLGLAVSYGIVQAHGGTLLVRNAPTRGAVFTIRLPIRSQPPA